jgi:bacillithiol biosynthesis deacetylase BshB1
MNDTLDILAFAPHPDDVELGCAGSLILAADKGWRVAVADLTEGEMSSRGNPVLRQQEKDQASAILGLTARYSVHLPDGGIGTHSAHRDPVIDLIRQTRPRIVLAPYWEDRHPDHMRASHLVREAAFFSGVGKIGEGHPYRPQHLFYYMLHKPFDASFIMDVSSVWERRMASVHAYGSQFQANRQEVETTLSRPEFLRALEARAVWFGWMIQAAYGEPFLSAAPLAAGDFPGLQPEGPGEANLPSGLPASRPLA